MNGLLVLLIHLVAVLARLAGPGGVRGLVAENLLMKEQLLVLSRSRHRAPNLSSLERFVLGLCTLFVSPSRIPKVAVGVRTSTLLKLHQCLVRRKYRALFSGRRMVPVSPVGSQSPHTRHRAGQDGAACAGEPPVR